MNPTGRSTDTSRGSRPNSTPGPMSFSLDNPQAPPRPPFGGGAPGLLPMEFGRGAVLPQPPSAGGLPGLPPPPAFAMGHPAPQFTGFPASGAPEFPPVGSVAQSGDFPPVGSVHRITPPLPLGRAHGGRDTPIPLGKPLSAKRKAHKTRTPPTVEPVVQPPVPVVAAPMDTSEEENSEGAPKFDVPVFTQHDRGYKHPNNKLQSILGHAMALSSSRGSSMQIGNLLTEAAQFVSSSTEKTLYESIGQDLEVICSQIRQIWCDGSRQVRFQATALFSEIMTTIPEGLISWAGSFGSVGGDQFPVAPPPADLPTMVSGLHASAVRLCGALGEMATDLHTILTKNAESPSIASYLDAVISLVQVVMPPLPIGPPDIRNPPKSCAELSEVLAEVALEPKNLELQRRCLPPLDIAGLLVKVAVRASLSDLKPVSAAGARLLETSMCVIYLCQPMCENEEYLLGTPSESVLAVLDSVVGEKSGALAPFAEEKGKPVRGLALLLCAIDRMKRFMAAPAVVDPETELDHRISQAATIAAGCARGWASCFVMDENSTFEELTAASSRGHLSVLEHRASPLPSSAASYLMKEACKLLMRPDTVVRAALAENSGSWLSGWTPQMLRLASCTGIVNNSAVAPLLSEFWASLKNICRTQCLLPRALAVILESCASVVTALTRAPGNCIDPSIDLVSPDSPFVLHRIAAFGGRDGGVFHNPLRRSWATLLLDEGEIGVKVRRLVHEDLSRALNDETPTLRERRSRVLFVTSTISLAASRLPVASSLKPERLAITVQNLAFLSSPIESNTVLEGPEDIPRPLVTLATIVPADLLRINVLAGLCSQAAHQAASAVCTLIDAGAAIPRDADTEVIVKTLKFLAAEATNPSAKGYVTFSYAALYRRLVPLFNLDNSSSPIVPDLLQFVRLSPCTPHQLLFMAIALPPLVRGGVISPQAVTACVTSALRQLALPDPHPDWAKLSPTDRAEQIAACSSLLSAGNYVVSDLHDMEQSVKRVCCPMGDHGVHTLWLAEAAAEPVVPLPGIRCSAAAPELACAWLLALGYAFGIAAPSFIVQIAISSRDPVVVELLNATNEAYVIHDQRVPLLAAEEAERRASRFSNAFLSLTYYLASLHTQGALPQVRSAVGDAQRDMNAVFDVDDIVIAVAARSISWSAILSLFSFKNVPMEWFRRPSVNGEPLAVPHDPKNVEDFAHFLGSIATLGFDKDADYDAASAGISFAPLPAGSGRGTIPRADFVSAAPAPSAIYLAAFHLVPEFYSIIDTVSVISRMQQGTTGFLNTLLPCGALANLLDTQILTILDQTIPMFSSLCVGLGFSQYASRFVQRLGAPSLTAALYSHDTATVRRAAAARIAGSWSNGAISAARDGLRSYMIETGCGDSENGAFHGNLKSAVTSMAEAAAVPETAIYEPSDRAMPGYLKVLQLLLLGEDIESAMVYSDEDAERGIYPPLAVCSRLGIHSIVQATPQAILNRPYILRQLPSVFVDGLRSLNAVMKSDFKTARKFYYKILKGSLSTPSNPGAKQSSARVTVPVSLFRESWTPTSIILSLLLRTVRVCLLTASLAGGLDVEPTPEAIEALNDVASCALMSLRAVLPNELPNSPLSGAIAALLSLTGAATMSKARFNYRHTQGIIGGYSFYATAPDSMGLVKQRPASLRLLVRCPFAIDGFIRPQMFNEDPMSRAKSRHSRGPSAVLQHLDERGGAVGYGESADEDILRITESTGLNALTCIIPYLVTTLCARPDVSVEQYEQLSCGLLKRLDLMGVVDELVHSDMALLASINAHKLRLLYLASHFPIVSSSPAAHFPLVSKLHAELSVALPIECRLLVREDVAAAGAESTDLLEVITKLIGEKLDCDVSAFSTEILSICAHLVSCTSSGNHVQRLIDTVGPTLCRFANVPISSPSVSNCIDALVSITTSTIRPLCLLLIRSYVALITNFHNDMGIPRIAASALISLVSQLPSCGAIPVIENHLRRAVHANPTIFVSQSRWLHRIVLDEYRSGVGNVLPTNSLTGASILVQSLLQVRPLSVASKMLWFSVTETTRAVTSEWSEGDVEAVVAVQRGLEVPGVNLSVDLPKTLYDGLYGTFHPNLIGGTIIASRILSQAHCWPMAPTLGHALHDARQVARALVSLVASESKFVLSRASRMGRRLRSLHLSHTLVAMLNNAVLPALHRVREIAVRPLPRFHAVAASSCGVEKTLQGVYRDINIYLVDQVIHHVSIVRERADATLAEDKTARCRYASPEEVIHASERILLAVYSLIFGPELIASSEAMRLSKALGNTGDASQANPLPLAFVCPALVPLVNDNSWAMEGPSLHNVPEPLAAVAVQAAHATRGVIGCAQAQQGGYSPAPFALPSSDVCLGLHPICVLSTDLHVGGGTNLAIEQAVSAYHSLGFSQHPAPRDIGQGGGLEYDSFIAEHVTHGVTTFDSLLQRYRGVIGDPDYALSENELIFILSKPESKFMLTLQSVVQSAPGTGHVEPQLLPLNLVASSSGIPDTGLAAVHDDNETVLARAVQAKNSSISKFLPEEPTLFPVSHTTMLDTDQRVRAPIGLGRLMGMTRVGPRSTLDKEAALSFSSAISCPGGELARRTNFVTALMHSVFGVGFVSKGLHKFPLNTISFGVGGEVRLMPCREASFAFQRDVLVLGHPYEPTAPSNCLLPARGELDSDRRALMRAAAIALAPAAGPGLFGALVSALASAISIVPGAVMPSQSIAHRQLAGSEFRPFHYADDGALLSVCSHASRLDSESSAALRSLFERVLPEVEEARAKVIGGLHRAYGKLRALGTASPEAAAALPLKANGTCSGRPLPPNTEDLEKPEAQTPRVRLRTVVTRLLRASNRFVAYFSQLVPSKAKAMDLVRQRAYDACAGCTLEAESYTSLYHLIWAAEDLLAEMSHCHSILEVTGAETPESFLQRVGVETMRNSFRSILGDYSSLFPGKEPVPCSNPVLVSSTCALALLLK